MLSREYASFTSEQKPSICAKYVHSDIQKQQQNCNKVMRHSKKGVKILTFWNNFYTQSVKV